MHRHHRTAKAAWCKPHVPAPGGIGEVSASPQTREDNQGNDAVGAEAPRADTSLPSSIHPAHCAAPSEVTGGGLGHLRAKSCLDNQQGQAGSSRSAPATAPRADPQRVNHEHPTTPINPETENHQKDSGTLPLGRGCVTYKTFLSFMVASHCSRKKGLIKTFVPGNVWPCRMLENHSVYKYISNPSLQVVTAIKHSSSFP